MMTTSLAEQQERTRIDQLIASDQANDEIISDVYLDALKLIKNNLQAFYVRYANDQGLTVTEVKRDVNKWDLAQFVDAIQELLEDGDKSDDELSKRLKLFQYQAAKGNRQDLIAAMIGATIAVATKHAHKTSRQHLVDDYANEQQWQSEALKRLSGHYEWTLPKQHDVKIKPDVAKTIDGSQWSDTLWNHSDAMVTDVQNVVRDALNNGMSQDNLSQLVKHLKPADKERGNLESAAKRRMWQIEALVRSESARVVDKATMDQLKKDNASLIDIVIEPDACKKCRFLAGMGPFKLENCPSFPSDTHPNCRCKKINHDLTKQKYIESLNNQYNLATESVGKDNVPKEFSDYTKMRYNDFKESRTFARYANSRAYNKIPAIVGYRDYKKIKRAATNAIVGSTTSDGVKVTSLSIHGLERIIGTDADYSHLKGNGEAPIREGVHFSDVTEALKSGHTASGNDDSARIYFNDHVRVLVNVKTGNIIQVNPL